MLNKGLATTEKTFLLGLFSFLFILIKIGGVPFGRMKAGPLLLPGSFPCPYIKEFTVQRHNLHRGMRKSFNGDLYFKVFWFLFNRTSP